MDELTLSRIPSEQLTTFGLYYRSLNIQLTKSTHNLAKPFISELEQVRQALASPSKVAKHPKAQKQLVEQATKQKGKIVNALLKLKNKKDIFQNHTQVANTTYDKSPITKGKDKITISDREVDAISVYDAPNFLMPITGIDPDLFKILYTSNSDVKMVKDNYQTNMEHDSCSNDILKTPNIKAPILALDIMIQRNLGKIFQAIYENNSNTYPSKTVIKNLANNQPNVVFGNELDFTALWLLKTRIEEYNDREPDLIKLLTSNNSYICSVEKDISYFITGRGKDVLKKNSIVNVQKLSDFYQFKFILVSPKKMQAYMKKFNGNNNNNNPNDRNVNDNVIQTNDMNDMLNNYEESELSEDHSSILTPDIIANSLVMKHCYDEFKTIFSRGTIITPLELVISVRTFGVISQRTKEQNTIVLYIFDTKKTNTLVHDSIIALRGILPCEYLINNLSRSLRYNHPYIRQQFKTILKLSWLVQSSELESIVNKNRNDFIISGPAHSLDERQMLIKYKDQMTQHSIEIMIFYLQRIQTGEKFQFLSYFSADVCDSLINDSKFTTLQPIFAYCIPFTPCELSYSVVDFTKDHYRVWCKSDEFPFLLSMDEKFLSPDITFSVVKAFDANSITPIFHSLIGYKGTLKTYTMKKIIESFSDITAAANGRGNVLLQNVLANYSHLMQFSSSLVGYIDSDAFGKWLYLCLSQTASGEFKKFLTWQEFSDFQDDERNISYLEAYAGSIIDDIPELSALYNQYNIVKIRNTIIMPSAPQESQVNSIVYDKDSNVGLNNLSQNDIDKDKDININTLADLNELSLGSKRKLITYMNNNSELFQKRFDTFFVDCLNHPNLNMFKFIGMLRSISDAPRLIFVNVHSDQEIAFINAEKVNFLSSGYLPTMAILSRHRDSSDLIVQYMLYLYYLSRSGEGIYQKLSTSKLLYSMGIKLDIY